MRSIAILARRYTAVLLIVLSAAPAAAKNHHATAAISSSRVPAIRIDNFGRISDAYYRGAQPQGRDYAGLAALGVKTVINLTSDDADVSEARLVERAGMSYLQIPMTTHRPPTQADIALFLATVSDSARQPVYVHCVGGKHRTGVMTAVYRMSQDHWTADQAFKEMKRYKFGYDFLHPEFKRFVYGYRADAVAVAAAVPATRTGG